ncbi:beta-lactamase class D [Pseudorhodobacter sp. 4114]|nr:beta-lactamase class D [Pseudorhodobacter sp. 4114]
MHRFLLGLTLLAHWAAPVQANTVCTLLMDAQTATVLHETGDCASRVTPASTFKLPLAVMAYDAGILTTAQAPVMAFRPGDPDWGGESWTRDTGPADWMRHSVVWYSQRITQAMGAEALTRYAQGFGYGNSDFSGDAGFDNGLERAWIASSLQISPREQAAFLRALVQDALPVAPAAMAQARSIVETRQVGDWVMHGKTGSAYPRRADRSFDYARGWGWYVGWAQRGNTTLIFVRLRQAIERSATSGGVLARDALLADWPALVAGD